MAEKNWTKKSVEVCVGEVFRGTQWFGVKMKDKEGKERRFVMREVKEFVWEKKSGGEDVI